MATSKNDKAGPGRNRRLSADARRTQILAVASEVFRTRPYGEVSLEEIAEAAGVARGLINHHFGTKRDLYVAVARRIIQVPELPVPDYVHGQTLRQRLDQSVTGWLDVIERNRAVWLDSIRTAGMGDPEIAALAEEAREQAARQAVRVMGLGPVEDLSPERLGMMRAWGALAEGAVLQWLEYQRLTREQVHELIVETGVRAAEGLIDEFAAVIGEGAASAARASRT